MKRTRINQTKGNKLKYSNIIFCSLHFSRYSSQQQTGMWEHKFQ